MNNHHEHGRSWITWPALGVVTVAAVTGGIMEVSNYVADNTNPRAPYISGINDNGRPSLPNVLPTTNDTNNVISRLPSPTDIPECRIVSGVC